MLQTTLNYVECYYCVFDFKEILQILCLKIDRINLLYYYKKKIYVYEYRQ